MALKKKHLKRDEIINSMKPLTVAEAELKVLLCFSGRYDRILAVVNKAWGLKLRLSEAV